MFQTLLLAVVDKILTYCTYYCEIHRNNDKIISMNFTIIS